jgi:hypothetical protein
MPFGCATGDVHDEASGTPVGALATGGGIVPGADVPLAIAGLAIVLAGGSLCSGA